MKTPANLILIACTLGNVLSLHAQSEQVSLEQCLAIARENHPSLEAARAAIDAADGAVEEAEANWWPRVDAIGGYHHWKRYAFLPDGLVPPGSTLPKVIGPTDDWNAAVTAQALVFDFGERRSGIDAAEAQRDAASADAGQVWADLRFAVQQAFYGLAAAQELEGVAARSRERALANQRRAEARNAAGDVPQADVLRTRAEVAEAELDVISARSGVMIARGRLNSVLGLSADEMISIDASFAALDSSTDVGAAIEHALSYRPELESARKRVDASEAKLGAARSANAPRVYADGSFGLRDSEFVPETTEWQAGVSVQIPLFDGGVRRGRVNRASFEAVRARALVAGLELRVREEVWSAAAERERSYAALAANEAVVEGRTESVRVIGARYEAGAALITDLLETETALAAAEASLARARWQYLIADSAFRRSAALDAQEVE
jgi:outer membrane protein TolC